MTYGVVRTFQVIVNTLLCLKRLASAVQLRPWPPHFKALIQIVSVIPVRSQFALAKHAQGGRYTCVIKKNLTPITYSSVRFGPPRGCVLQ
jgi:hypothetical protein